MFTVGVTEEIRSVVDPNLVEVIRLYCETWHNNHIGDRQSYALVDDLTRNVTKLIQVFDVLRCEDYTVHAKFGAMLQGYTVTLVTPGNQTFYFRPHFKE